MNEVLFKDLGLISYAKAWEYQQSLHDALKERKLQHRRAGIDQFDQTHHLLLCEHRPVYTIGKSGSMEHLLLSGDELEKEGFEFFKINRGGDITYHGPGQIVGYPIFDLDCFFTDVHLYVRKLEEVIILTLKEFGIEATRMKGYTGVWIEGTDYLPNRKICAIGVHLSRWVTMHGFALNVHPDLKHFNHIIPCGIADESKTVTSMEVELQREVDQGAVKESIKRHFAEQFEFKYIEQAIITNSSAG